MDALSLKLEQYEGPLDLLLALITKHKIDIFDIPISQLCDQYMAYIDAAQRMNMELATDFLYMASELMLIKSKLLLPTRQDDDDPRKVLVDALLEHKRAQAIAEFLKVQGEQFFDRFTKMPDESDSTYFKEHAVHLLTEAFARMRDRVKQSPEIRTALFDKIETEHYYTVDSKIISILRQMYDGERKTLFDLFRHSHSRSETVAIFLALLELVRAGRIELLTDKKELGLKIIK
ncbi:MAG: segregation/condensation protein A [Clostridia bacterium]